MGTEDIRTISKARVMEWIALLLQEADVVAPVAAHGEDVVFSSISSPEQLTWNFGNTLHPPKQFVLPQTDPLFEIKPGERGYQVEPVDHDRQLIIFNMRSCDVTGVRFLTQVHAADLPDDTYLKRVENTTLVSLACTSPCPECFCTCTDSGPFLQRGHDVQLTDLGERFLAEAGSDKGRFLMDRGSMLFQPAVETDLAEQRRLELLARSSFGSQTCHFGAAMRRVSTGRVKDELWEEMSPWCLECGGCNMICPTCYCFSVKDRKQNNGWVRCRIWDSCQYPAFTREASGHNPRADRKDRMKRRFFHKVSAQYYVRDGMVGCVGCGRCVKVCLGTTDMPAVVSAIRKGVWHG